MPAVFSSASKLLGEPLRVTAACVVLLMRSMSLEISPEALKFSLEVKMETLRSLLSVVSCMAVWSLVGGTRHVSGDFRADRVI